MGAIRQGKQRFSRNALKSSASVLGLAAGAVSWSGLAQAAEGERSLQTLLLPEHYQILDDGTVVFALKTGEQMSLTEEQYVLLDGGLVLVVDELAQDTMAELPVMGSLRTQLLTEIGPVRSPDGSIVEVSSTQPLWSGEGPTPRLFEDVDLKTYEVAQDSGSDDEAIGLPLAGAIAAAPSTMWLLGMLMTSDEPEAETPTPPAPPTPAPPSAPEFWTDDDVANSASTAITGSNGDSFVGYTAASTSATPDPLTSIGVGSTATFDMSAGGNNKFAARSSAGYSGVLSYTGGSGDDSLTFSGIYLAAGSGSATFDMSLGGDNTFVAASSAAYSSGFISYTGGSGDDSLIFGDFLAVDGATATFDMSAGGTNSFVAGGNVAYVSGSFAYTGGSGDDSLTFGDDLAYEDGTATFDMSQGGNNTFVAGSSAASSSGSLAYTGGTGEDSLTFGPNLVMEGGTATFDMSLGGNNTFVAGQGAASSSGSIAYTGGSGGDSLTFGDLLANGSGAATFDMSAGGDNTFVAGRAAAGSSGAIVYKGGNGIDTLTFGSNAALTGGSIDIRLGADAAADKVTFQGSIGGSGGTVTIKNFNYNDDTIDVAAGVSAVGGEIADAGGNLTWTDSGGSHTVVFKGIGTGGTGVVATSAQLAADII